MLQMFIVNLTTSSSVCQNASFKLGSYASLGGKDCISQCVVYGKCNHIIYHSNLNTLKAPLICLLLVLRVILGRSCIITLSGPLALELIWGPYFKM